MKILLTGGTGFIGQRLAKNLAAAGNDVHVLTRKESRFKASQIFEGVKNISFMEGDIADSDVLAHISNASSGIDAIECVVHLAAHYDLEASFSEAYLMNVLGTQNLLNLMKKMGKLRHFHYYSTYAVNPVTAGHVGEDFLLEEVDPGLDHYTRTKNTAEYLVRTQAGPGYQTIIHRPGVIVGDSQTGKMDKVDGPYYFFSFVDQLRKLPQAVGLLGYLPLPVKKTSRSQILPVDVLVDWSTRIIQNPKGEGLRCYHLIPSEPVFTLDFLEASLGYLGSPIRKIHPVGAPKVFSPVFTALKLPPEMIFFLNQEATFDRTNLNRDYPDLPEPDWHDYLPALIKGHKGRPA